MRVLVTGGAGFIGSHVVSALLGAHHDVVVVDNLSHGDKSFVPPLVQLIEDDILNPSGWQHTVGTIDAVIHLAAQISVPLSEADPLHDVRTNLLGTVTMLKVARDLGAREFRMTSSAAVYGDNPRLPLCEEDAGDPLSYYGLDKWASEFYVAHEERQRHLKGVVFRPANVYGPRQRTAGEGGVVAMFAETLSRHETPVIYGDGLQTRDFIFVKDVAQAFLYRLGIDEPGGIYNLGTNTSTTVIDLWNQLADIAGADSRTVSYASERPGDIRHSRLSVQRADGWGFHAKVTLDEGLRETYQYFQSVSAKA